MTKDTSNEAIYFNLHSTYVQVFSLCRYHTVYSSYNCSVVVGMMSVRRGYGGIR